jgi:hypothetical protein
MRVDVRKLTQQVYEASVNGEILCRSRTPLLSAARVLVERGLDPDTELRMVRHGSDTTSMRVKAGDAAKLTVVEDGRGIRLRYFKPYAGLK